MKNMSTPVLVGIAIMVVLVAAAMFLMRSPTANAPTEKQLETMAEQDAEMADLGAELETLDTDFDADLQKLDVELQGL